MKWLIDNLMTILGVVGAFIGIVGSAFGLGLHLNNKIKAIVLEETNEMLNKLVLVEKQINTAIQEKTYNKDMTNISDLIRELKDDMSVRLESLTDRIDLALTRRV